MEIQLHLKLLLLITLIQKPFILERVKETYISGKAIHVLNLQKFIKDQWGAFNGLTVFCSLQEAKIVYWKFLKVIRLSRPLILAVMQYLSIILMVNF